MLNKDCTEHVSTREWEGNTPVQVKGRSRVSMLCNVYVYKLCVDHTYENKVVCLEENTLMTII
jgi:hypothetical protein